MGVWEDVSGYLDTARDRGLALYGSTLAEFQGGVPAAALAEYAGKESGFRRWAKTLPQGKPPAQFREAGFVQATTTADRRGECERFNFDPFDVRSSLWGAARIFEAAQVELARALDVTGWARLELHPIIDQVALTLSVRSVGIGCTRGLLRKAKSIPCNPGPLTAILAWLHKPGADCGAFCGVQGHDSVRTRIARNATIALRAGELGIGGVCVRLLPAPPRPVNLAPCPANLYARLDVLAAAAKREGDRPSGKWPVGVCAAT